MYTVLIYYPTPVSELPAELSGRTSMRRLARGFSKYVLAFESVGAVRFFTGGCKNNKKCRKPFTGGCENYKMCSKGLTWDELMPDGFRMLTFDTKEELFYYVRGFDYIDFFGVQRNSFLDAVMCNPNDVRRHSVYIGKRQIYLQGYLTLDANGKVVDLRHHEDELYRFDNKAYRIEKNTRRDAERVAKLEKEETESEALWAKQHQRWAALPDWRPYCRNIRTTQERRFASDIEHKPYIRDRRKKLPDSWSSEIYINNAHSWKVRTKAKKQWLIHRKTHHDTIKFTNFKRTEFDLLIALEGDL